MSPMFPDRGNGVKPSLETYEASGIEGSKDVLIDSEDVRDHGRGCFEDVYVEVESQTKILGLVSVTQKEKGSKETSTE